MKKWLLVVFMGVCLLQAGAQEKNIVRDDNVQVRSISGFTGIEVSGAISLYLSQGNEEAVARVLVSWDRPSASEVGLNILYSI